MKKILIGMMAFLLVIPFNVPVAEAGSLDGRILLQVQENGEAWYVNPLDGLRYFMGRPNDAFALMREFGLGITNANLDQIPVGFIPLTGDDFDGDGLSDDFEHAVGLNDQSFDSDGDGMVDKVEIEKGYTPRNPNRTVNKTLQNNMRGRILLQVEGSGESWYVNPVDGKRYFLGRPGDAFAVMRGLGLGITNADLGKIGMNVLLTHVDKTGEYSISFPQSLKYNKEVSESFAAENDGLTYDFYLSKENKQGLVIFQVSSEDEATIQEFANEYTKDPGILTTPEIGTVSGFPAMTNVEIDEGDGGMQFLTIVQIRPDNYYIIQFIAPLSDRERLRAVYTDYIIDSFEFIQ